MDDLIAFYHVITEKMNLIIIKLPDFEFIHSAHGSWGIRVLMIIVKPSIRNE